MSIYVPEGASMPAGIDVDETAAYFGITSSSDLLPQLNAMDRLDAIRTVLERISDLLLTGTFNLDSGSERLDVESGEIYYILSGPLKLLEVTEPLRDYLGLGADNNASNSLSPEIYVDLEAMLDPLELLRIYAVGDVVGGADELNKYIINLEAMLSTPSQNIESLVGIRRQMGEILSETTQMAMPRPIEILAKMTIPKIPAASTHSDPVTLPEPVSEPAPSPPDEVNELSIPKPLEQPVEKPKAPLEGAPVPLIEAQPLQRPATAIQPTKPVELQQPKSVHADESTSFSLPKPVVSPKQHADQIEAPNNVMRAFPQGQLCPGCGVSQKGSWRYCPLCGHTA